jgi:hypothetical protein
VAAAPGDAEYPLRIAYGGEGATGDRARFAGRLPVLTKTDRPKVLAAPEQWPCLIAAVAADPPDMTSTANDAAQAPGEARP